VPRASCFAWRLADYWWLGSRIRHRSIGCAKPRGCVNDAGSKVCGASGVLLLLLLLLLCVCVCVCVCVVLCPRDVSDGRPSLKPASIARVHSACLWFFQQAPLWRIELLLPLTGLLMGGPANLISATIAADLGTHPLLAGNEKALATVTSIIGASCMA